MPSSDLSTDMTQEAPMLFSRLMDAWGLGSLGNPEIQRVRASGEPFSSRLVSGFELTPAGPFHSTSPRTRLSALKALHFIAATRQERVERSLQALTRPLGIHLSPGQWTIVVDLAEEDDE